MKKYQYSELFTNLIQDLAILEKDGIEINGVNLKGSIAYFVADSLGANSICGYTESFNSPEGNLNKYLHLTRIFITFER